VDGVRRAREDLESRPSDGARESLHRVEREQDVVAPGEYQHRHAEACQIRFAIEGGDGLGLPPERLRRLRPRVVERPARRRLDVRRVREEARREDEIEQPAEPARAILACVEAGAREPVATSTSRSTSPGWRSAIRCATNPPIEWPSTAARAIPRRSSSAAQSSAIASIDTVASWNRVRPTPRLSGAMTRRRAPRSFHTVSHDIASEARPATRSSAPPEPCCS